MGLKYIQDTSQLHEMRKSSLFTKTIISSIYIPTVKNGAENKIDMIGGKSN